jgi:ubiquinone biosynthesis protein
VHIPTLERSLSGQRVLTQEFVRGVKISDVDAMRAAGLDVEAIGESALRAAMKMLIIDGFFHADPHPGNLFVDLDTGVVTFLDSGMVGELTIGQRAHLGMLLWTFVKADIPAMAEQILSLSVPFRPVDENAFRKDFERKMARYGKATAPDVKLVLSTSMGVLRDNGLRLDPQLTLALKAMTQASAFFTQLAPPDRTFASAALEAVHALAEQSITEEVILDAAKRQSTKLAGQAIKDAPDYIKGLLSWRDQIKRGKFTLYLDTSSLDNQVYSLRTMVSTVVVALLVAGGMIGSAIAATVFDKTGNPALTNAANAGFFASLAIAAVLVFIFLARMIREDKARTKDRHDH